MHPILDTSAISIWRDAEPSFFDAIDADTAIARCRLLDALSRVTEDAAEARGILQIGDAAALVSAAGRRLDRFGAIQSYLEIARGEPASLFAGLETGRSILSPGGTSAIVSAQLDDFALRLAHDREPVRLFGLVFAIERTRHMLFTARRDAGCRLSGAKKPSPALSHRFAALIDAIGAAPADQAQILAQAHAAYEVIERMIQALLAAGVPATSPVGRIGYHPASR